MSSARRTGALRLVTPSNDNEVREPFGAQRSRRTRSFEQQIRDAETLIPAVRASVRAFAEEHSIRVGAATVDELRELAATLGIADRFAGPDGAAPRPEAYGDLLYGCAHVVLLRAGAFELLRDAPYLGSAALAACVDELGLLGPRPSYDAAEQEAAALAEPNEFDRASLLALLGMTVATFSEALLRAARAARERWRVRTELRTGVECANALRLGATVLETEGRFTVALLPASSERDHLVYVFRPRGWAPGRSVLEHPEFDRSIRWAVGLAVVHADAGALYNLTKQLSPAMLNGAAVEAARLFATGAVGAEAHASRRVDHLGDHTRPAALHVHRLAEAPGSHAGKAAAALGGRMNPRQLKTVLDVLGAQLRMAERVAEFRRAVDGSTHPSTEEAFERVNHLRDAFDELGGEPSTPVKEPARPLVVGFCEQACLYLIAELPTGVFYASQAGGHSCSWPEIEGAIIASADDEDGRVLGDTMCDLGCYWRTLEPADVSTANEQLAAIQWEVFDGIEGLRLDETRLTESFEGWWRVTWTHVRHEYDALRTEHRTEMRGVICGVNCD